MTPILGIYPSWPKAQSVNDGVKTDSYLGTAFQLYYPSVDYLVSRLNSLGPTAKISNLISAGSSGTLMGLCHKRKYYLNLALTFGFRLGSIFCQKTSDAVRCIMHQNGHKYLQNYIIFCNVTFPLP